MDEKLTFANAGHPQDMRSYSCDQIPIATKNLSDLISVKERELATLEYALATIQHFCPHSESEKYRNYETGTCPNCGIVHLSKGRIDRIFID